MTCTPYIKFKYIFQFLAPTLPIYYVTFIGLRWRIRDVLCGPLMLKVRSVTCVLHCLQYIWNWMQMDTRTDATLYRPNKVCTLVARRRSKNALAAGASRYAKTAVCNVWYFDDIWRLIAQIWKILCSWNNNLSLQSGTNADHMRFDCVDSVVFSDEKTMFFCRRHWRVVQ